MNERRVIIGSSLAGIVAAIVVVLAIPVVEASGARPTTDLGSRVARLEHEVAQLNRLIAAQRGANHYQAAQLTVLQARQPTLTQMTDALFIPPGASRQLTLNACP